jgi:hypothetical protein
MWDDVAARNFLISDSANLYWRSYYQPPCEEIDDFLLDYAKQMDGCNVKESEYGANRI